MVVIAIIAIIAGTVVSKIDWVRRSANNAVGAETAGALAQNIQLYLNQTETLPNGLDSLIDQTGALYTGPNGTTGLIGGTDAVGNLPTQLVATSFSGTTTPDTRYLNSLFRVGMRFVNNHSSTATDATNSGTVATQIGTPGNPNTFNTITLACVKAGTSMWNSIYPTNVWSNPTSGTGTTLVANGTDMQIDAAGNNVRLVAMGVGPNNSMIGATMQAPPQYPGPQSNLYYYRYVVVFSVYSDGRRAQIKGVFDPFGRSIASSLNQYTTSGPDELPVGTRSPE